MNSQSKELQTSQRWLSRLVKRVNDMRPDLLVIVGDVVDATTDRSEMFLPILEDFRAPLGVWEDRRVLEGWVRATTAEQRLALRARIVQAVAAGTGTERIAVTEGIRPATVSKWRKPYAGQGLSGLQDGHRPGAVRRYDSRVERRVLEGLSTQAAEVDPRLLARTLGDVPRHHIWRILRRQRHSPAAAQELVHQHRLGVCSQSSGRGRTLSEPARKRSGAVGG